MTKSEMSLLIQLAAEMIRETNMPLEFIEDWKLPKSTTRITQRKIMESTKNARLQCNRWANRIVKIVDDAKRKTK